MEETNSIEQWMTLASSKRPEDREVAARALRAHVQDRSGSTALIDLLGDADWRVRRAAVETFLQAQEVQTIPMVLDALYEEENAGKRNAALDVLARFGKGIIPYLAPHISADQSDVRMFLIQILGDLRDTTYLRFIHQALQDENPNVVSAAIIALGKIGRPDSIPQLLRFLEGHDLWLKTQAIEALGEMQEPETIRNLLAVHSIRYCRKAIIKALSKFHDPQSYRALIEFLVHEGRPDLDALDALAQLYYAAQPARLKTEEQQAIREDCRKNLQPDSIAALLEAYPDCSIAERKNILEILGWAAADVAIPLFLGELQNEPMGRSAASGLIYCGKTGMQAVLERLNKTSSQKEILAFLTVLIELPEVIEREHLERFLKQDDVEIRQAAHKLLARIPSADTVPFWIDSISDADPLISELAAEALLSFSKKDAGARAAIEMAMSEKTKSPDPRERANAFQLLILIRGPESLSLLFQAIKDPDADVRRKAAHLMASGHHPEFSNHLIAALADEDERVRELAAKGLSFYKSPEVTKVLLSLFKDEVLWVRIAAYESLAAQNADGILPQLLHQLAKEEPLAQSALLRCIGRFRGDASKTLILQYAQSDDPEIRKGACEALSGWKDRDIVFRLFALFESDPDWRVRVAAIRILAGLRPFALQDALVQALEMDRDPLVRREILVALRQLPLVYLPEQVYELLLDEELMDEAYEFLLSCREQFAIMLQQQAELQPPPVRRLLQAAAR